MEIKGIVKLVGQTQQVTDSYRKRELVIIVEPTSQYPQPILVEFGQDKCDLLNNVQVGMDITVHINLRGREWTNPQGELKHFNSIQGWKVDLPQMQPQNQGGFNQGYQQQAQPQVNNGFNQGQPQFNQGNQGFQQQPNFNQQQQQGFQNNQGFNNQGQGGFDFNNQNR